MTLVVNELETNYRDRAAFIRIDAQSEQGLTAYKYYGLKGHPAILIFDAKGQLTGQMLGQQPMEQVDSALQAVLAP